MQNDVIVQIPSRSGQLIDVSCPESESEHVFITREYTVTFVAASNKQIWTIYGAQFHPWSSHRGR